MRVGRWFGLLVGVVCVSGAACAPASDSGETETVESALADVGLGDGAIPASRIAAIVDGHVITRDEVLHAVEGLSPLLRERFETVEGQRAFLNSLVDKQLIVAEGRRRGVHRSPDIRRRVRAFEDRLVAQAMVTERQPTVPDDAALTRYFEANRDDFEIPEAVDIGRIVLRWGPSAGPAAQAEVRDRAARLRARLIAGEPFAEVAAEGHGTERSRGGRLGWRPRGSFESVALEEAAFAIGELGALSPLVEAEDGVHLFTLFDRRRARLPALAEVRGAVIARYRKHEERAALDTLAESLRAAADIELRPENLEAP